MPPAVDGAIVSSPLPDLASIILTAILPDSSVAKNWKIKKICWLFQGRVVMFFRMEDWKPEDYTFTQVKTMQKRIQY